MVIFFKGKQNIYFALDTKVSLSEKDLNKLEWLFGNAQLVDEKSVSGIFIGPRKEMITPWSTNAVEITQNMGISGIQRIEEFKLVDLQHDQYDEMLEARYENLSQEIFVINKQPDEIVHIDDIKKYNEEEALALNQEEIDYLENLAKKLGRKLTDSEVFGFSQVNSEHCRHKIFNGKFIIDGEEKESSLFQLIKKTSKENPNYIVSAYKDNVAFVDGSEAIQFAPKTQDKADFFEEKTINTVLSLKAETHNFPTTVEPFNGAATGSGGEIRDRMAGGKGSIPLAGTAVYMTSYPRTEEGRKWEKATTERNWLYQTPLDILIKASNGASDFGNKFGQPLICGSVLTFEHFENDNKLGFDKVIMQAGGVGFAKKADSIKEQVQKGEKIVILGGDNYRIGMGGSAVSSVATGEFANSVELNAIQRSNPEMQKRACNAIRAMAEMDVNPIVSIHDHGAGGHLNCLSELVEDTGGKIDLNKLPVGDPTLSAKEIVGNESQERMGLVIKEQDVNLLADIAKRERAPIYVVGETSEDNTFTFEDKKTNDNPIDLKLEDMFGKTPPTVMIDNTKEIDYSSLGYDLKNFNDYFYSVLQLEAVACKDWLTNKVDRSVTGRVAKQQTCGKIQLPLNNVAVMAIDYTSNKGIATSIGHSPISGLIDPKAGAVNSIAEALTNIIWAPLSHDLKSISLSANWMWPCKNEGEDARLYEAVNAISDFAIELGINVPTGKDSLSMTQKYKDDKVVSPGTVIISAIGESNNINQIVSPVLNASSEKALYHINLSSDEFKLGGSSFGQIINKVGTEAPTVKDAAYFKKAFNTIQSLIKSDLVLSGHDISAGGMITAIAEMCFTHENLGLEVNLDGIEEKDLIKVLFAENAGILVQFSDEKEALEILNKNGINATKIGNPAENSNLIIKKEASIFEFKIDQIRNLWYKSSYLLDKHQTRDDLALARYSNYSKQTLSYNFNPLFTGKLKNFGLELNRTGKSGIKAAIIREKGVNGDREMAFAMHLAGFDVKDVHMTDLISGKENLEDVNMITFVGGFSNSDVLGSAKGWAGAFLYNEKAQKALTNFYQREDTLSLGICNGCQLMMELELLYPELDKHPKMQHNESGKFESGFINVSIEENDSVMLSSLSGSRLGVWVAHGEGKFDLNYDETSYNICSKYSYEAYPGNPNGSDYATAALVSKNGRHLAMMPHLERATFPWNWAYYPENRKKDEVSPWIEAFVNAKKWVENKTK